MTENGTLVRNQAQWQELLASLAGDRSVDVPAPSSFPFFFCSFRCDDTRGFQDRTLVLIVKAHGPTHIIDISPLEITTVEVAHARRTINVNRFPSEIADVVLKEKKQLVRADARGWLAEVARFDEDGEISMVYCSSTAPGIIRGPHEHRNQTDRFLFIGSATVWLWDNRKGSPTDGARSKIKIKRVTKVVVPPGVVHAYRNDARLLNLTVVNAPDQLYKGRARQEPVDEIRHEDDPANKFNLW